MGFCSETISSDIEVVNWEAQLSPLSVLSSFFLMGWDKDIWSLLLLLLLSLVNGTICLHT